MGRYGKASFALLVTISLNTISSPLMTQASQHARSSTASIHAIKAADEKISGIVPFALVGRQYRAQLRISGGTAPYHWKVVSGSVPLGLTLNNMGVLSGRPKRTGESNFAISVTGANRVTQSSTFTISILPADERVISVNGFSRPVPVRVRRDPVHKDLTTFISLIDLQGTLGAFGMYTYWNGKSMNLVPGPFNPFSATGSTTAKNAYPIYMYGRIVGSLPSAVKSGADTFLPLYNVMEALKHVQGLKQTWDGTTWSITGAPASQWPTSTDTNSMWNWTGTWVNDATSDIQAVDVMNVTDKSFNFDLSGVTGTAYLSGNTATYTDKSRSFSIVFTKASPTDFTLVVHGGYDNPAFSGPKGIPYIRGVYQLEPLQAILSTANNVAIVTGRSSLPVGTPVTVQVRTFSSGTWNISWSTKVQQGGLINTSHSLSTLGNGPLTIQAQLSASQGAFGRWTITNTVTEAVDN